MLCCEANIVPWFGYMLWYGYCAVMCCVGILLCCFVLFFGAARVLCCGARILLCSCAM